MLRGLGSDTANSKELVSGNYKIRIGCYQSLALISENPELNLGDKMKQIREQETDPRALEAYQLFGD